MSAVTARDEQSGQEFAFGDKDFRFLSATVYEKTGIVLKDHKKNMVYSRLARRLRELKLNRFSDYCALLKSREGADEVGFLINAITTNLTKFFREIHHFEHLKDVVIPEVSHMAAATGRNRLRIWSAGCSSGEEPYSIAMTLTQAMPRLATWDARILATDLDTTMVARGKAGVYPASAIADLPGGYRGRFFGKAPGAGDSFQVAGGLKDLIAFKQLNLLGPWPMRGPFDAIFCRNVMIYFDEPTKAKLIDRFSGMLRPGGWLYIGHSETLLDVQSLFELKGRTVYRRRG
jgi:chemotaxis protein methyltransferase CheR